MQPHAVSTLSQSTSTPPSRLLRIGEVQRLTGLSRPMIYRLVAASSFPRQIRVTEATAAWVESEVQSWIEGRIAAARGEA